MDKPESQASVATPGASFEQEAAATESHTLGPRRVPSIRRRLVSGLAARRSALGVQLARVALIGAGVGAWGVVSSSGVIDPVFISSPGDVWNSLEETVPTSQFWLNFRVTMTETMIGFTVGSFLGIVVGIVLAGVRPLNVLLDPFLTFLNSLPRVALAPLFILWFGIDELSKIMLAISLVFFIMVFNTRAGVISVDQDMVINARLLGANRRHLAWKVVLPGAVPSVFAGLRLSIIYALLGVVTGEMIAAEFGIGQQLTTYAGTFDTAGVLGLLFVLGMIGTTLNGVMAIIERRLLRWQDS